MWILIARHGKAEEKKVGQPDEARRLTVEGRKDVEMVARLLPIKPSIVYSSPLKRAIETAEIIAKVWNIEVRIIDELRPELTSLERL
ncbi:MAG TPA: phosphohistidine phosphatase SixA, partial [Ignisphaera sp.]|nr:phosphohistidine phosphatase SixA [Ignisphaera sp.]